MCSWRIGSRGPFHPTIPGLSPGPGRYDQQNLIADRKVDRVYGISVTLARARAIENCAYLVSSTYEDVSRKLEALRRTASAIFVRSSPATPV